MKTIRGVGLITLMCGVSTLIPQYLVAVNLGAELPAFAGSLVSLIVIVFMAKNRKEKTAPELGDADDFLDCFIMPAHIVGGTFQG